MSLISFHGRASFDAFVPFIIGKASDLETHEVLGYFPNHREEIVCTGIRVSQEASWNQGIGSRLFGIF